uniref:Uncharacterized protein n=1 Tax=Tetraselmis sp. GSL018 TaxID=582737 RepID=A0A061S6T0_9CHLO
MGPWEGDRRGDKGELNGRGRAWEKREGRRPLVRERERERGSQAVGERWGQVFR